MRLYANMDIYTVAARLRTTPQAIAAAEEGRPCGRELVERLQSLYVAS